MPNDVGPLGLPLQMEIALVPPNADKVIVLERIKPGVEPDFCVHGQTQCYHCDHWCWLGDNTFKMVRRGQARPLCWECAVLFIRDDSGLITTVQDHRTGRSRG